MNEWICLLSFAQRELFDMKYLLYHSAIKLWTISWTFFFSTALFKQKHTEAWFRPNILDPGHLKKLKRKLYTELSPQYKKINAYFLREIV